MIRNFILASLVVVVTKETSISSASVFRRNSRGFNDKEAICKICILCLLFSAPHHNLHIAIFIILSFLRHIHQRSPTPSSGSPDPSISSEDGSCQSPTRFRSFSESFFTVKGAAIVLPRSECVRHNTTATSGSSIQVDFII